MFLIPKKNLKNFNADRCCIVLNEFAAAEFSSAIEMMYAAKNINNTKLSYGFIKHALDEYNHSFIFNNIKKKIISKYKISKNQLSFIPMQLYYKGYLKKDGKFNIAGSLNKLNKKGSTFSNLSGPPKLKSITAFFINNLLRY